MPAVIPFIPLIAAGVGATAAVVSSKISSNTARRSADQALDYAKEQEAERRREWDIQSKAAQAQWDTNQANLAPYRAARAAILRKHGIDMPDVVLPKAPDFSGGPPPGWKPGDPLTGAGTTVAKPSSSSGGMGGALALGAHGGAVGAIPGLYEKYLMNKKPEVAGPPSSMIQGGPIATPLPAQVPTSGLSNWPGYAGYGVPDQAYYGE